MFRVECHKEYESYQWFDPAHTELSAKKTKKSTDYGVISTASKHPNGLPCLFQILHEICCMYLHLKFSDS